MTYLTYHPHPDLASLVKCYWTLQIPAQKDVERQRIVPDGCIEMFFILGDDVKRYTTNDEFILQPRAMVLGQITEPFYVQPTGFVNTFAVRFYPYGFANFVSTSIATLANTETPLSALFGEETSRSLTQDVIQSTDTGQRIEIIERFLIQRLTDKATVDHLVKTTVDALFSTGGSTSISTILSDDSGKRRQLERKFLKQIGMSPKQLGKVIRLQTALKMLLGEQSATLTDVAYESDYYDQAHFIKDFKEFTGTTPKDFASDDKMVLSSLFYKEP